MEQKDWKTSLSKEWQVHTERSIRRNTFLSILAGRSRV